jgi:hypothetical protein
LLRLLKLSQPLVVKTANILFEPMSNLDLVEPPLAPDASARNDTSVHQLFDKTPISSKLLNQFIQIVEIARHGFGASDREQAAGQLGIIQQEVGPVLLAHNTSGCALKKQAPK